MDFKRDMKVFLAMLRSKQKMLPQAQLLCWANWFSQYTFKVKHIPGKENVLADFLSRNKPLIAPITEVVTYLPPEVLQTPCLYNLVGVSSPDTGAIVWIIIHAPEAEIERDIDYDLSRNKNEPDWSSFKRNMAIYNGANPDEINPVIMQVDYPFDPAHPDDSMAREIPRRSTAGLSSRIKEKPKPTGTSKPRFTPICIRQLDITQCPSAL
ncbi:hypothetical protein ACLOJK_003323 [Asimina triloba]